MQAYILINTEPGKLWKVKEEALKIPGVKMAHAVTGQFDVIAYIEVANLDELGRVIDRIQSITGVLKTHTAISMADRLTDEL